MGKIFCLMGKSCSGKDTLLKKLLTDQELYLKYIVPYTTRPKRDNEKDGREYNFINLEKLEQYKKQDKVIEIRKYNTTKGIWYYCTIDDGRLDIERDSFILVATLEAFGGIRDYFGLDRVVPLYIDVDDYSRLKRALKREKRQKKPDYEEMCRRFLADAKDFSFERLAFYKIHEKYVNDDIDECYKEIKRKITLPEQ